MNTKHFSKVKTNVLQVLSLIVVILLGACAENTSSTSKATKVTSAPTVEVMLVSNIDDERGYCLDIAGGKGERAPLNKGLQAHTCYHYTGEILVDQAFDQADVDNGQFRIPYFNVCMSADSIEQGTSIVLAECTDQVTQQFSLQPNGNITLKSDNTLCVTVSATEKREGRGGEPVHVMRPLSLQACESNIAEYQTWTLFSI